MQTPNNELHNQNRNFWRGPSVRLRAVESYDLDAILTSTEEPDTEIDRHEDGVGVPRSREAERDNLATVAKQVGENDFRFCLIEDRQRQMVGAINSFDCVRRNGHLQVCGYHQVVVLAKGIRPISDNHPALGD